jgi:hypothetical protein
VRERRGEKRNSVHGRERERERERENLKKKKGKERKEIR